MNKRTLGKVVLGVGAAVAVLTIVIATRPSTFHLERSITVAAPPEVAFARVNDFQQWGAWSPYEKLDPQMQRTFEGPRAGRGALYAWQSDGRAGSGRMTIQESDAAGRIVIKLDFLEPMKVTNTATFTFVPTAGGARVTWAMDGENNFVAKAVSLAFDMDKMVGDDFEQGLAALKTLSESAVEANAEATNDH